MREWQREREHGTKAGAFSRLWGISRSTHWRWVKGRWKEERKRVKRISEYVRRQVIEIDRRYRSTWDVHAIAHIVGISPTTVAKILLEVRGPRPKRTKHPHTRRTRFIRRDVMWSSDFVRLVGGWMLVKTMDEMSGYRLGWDLVRSENAEQALAHAQSIAARMGRVPLVWKYDHGSAFTSAMFQKFLAERMIVPYPTQPRAPWTNGRVERDHQEIHNWLIPLEGKTVSEEEIEKEIDGGMWMLNFIKPRACLGFRKSAETYFEDEAGGLENADDEIRGMFQQAIDDAKTELGCADSLDPNQLKKKSGERLHRKAVRIVMQRWKLYEEWDTAEPEGTPEDKIVNRSAASNVSF